MDKNRYLHFIFIWFIFHVIPVTTLQAHSSEHLVATEHQARGIKFIENKGQWTKAARYKAEIPGGTLFLTDNGFVYNFIEMMDCAALHESADTDHEHSEGFRGHAYKVKFEGASEAVTYQAEAKASYYHNYFIGSDADKWVGDVGLYERVRQTNIYDGVDMHIYAHGESGLKYDFIVQPGVDPAIIRLSFEGVEPEILEDGSLLISTSVSEVREGVPLCYQVINGEKQLVQARYQYQNGLLSFIFPDGYNPDYELIIDPELIYATFSGGTGSANYAHSTCYDLSGNTYTAALAYGAGWPTTTGAYQTVYPGDYCVAINKYSPDGSTLIYSTYFGGSSENVQPNTMRVTGNNELVMAGNVTSPDMPTTSGAYDSTLGGTSDIYIARFSADGTALLASTYVGGTGFESLLIGSTSNYANLGAYTNAVNPTDIAFDAEGNIWVASNSASTDFPVTTNAEQSVLGGSHDVVLFKMPLDLSGLTYSTFLGGNDWDGAIGIEYNTNTDEIVVAGFTKSSNFPTSSGAYHATQPGGEDGFVVKFDNASYALLAATYLGTSSHDKACRVAFDCAGNIFIAGVTEGGNYPITAPDSSGVVPNGYVFIDKLSPGLTNSIASTRTGINHAYIVPSSLMVDICGNILVATIRGNSAQQGMPLTPDAFETNPRAFYFAAYEPNFTGLLFGSYYGSVSTGTSTTDHFHPGICRMDPHGIIYHSVCASGTSAANYPTTDDAYAPNKLNGTTNDNITFKFDFEAVGVDLVAVTGSGGRDSIPHAVRGCLPAYFEFERGGDLSEEMVLRYELSGTATQGVDYADVPDSLIFAPGVDSASLEIKPLLISGAGNPDPMDVIITVFSPCGCEDGSDNIIAIDTIRIYDSLYVNILTAPQATCSNDEIEITAEIDSTLTFAWSPEALIPDPRPLGLTIHPKPTQTMDFTITVNQPGAPSTCPPNSQTYTAVVEQYPQITMPAKDTSVCLVSGDSIDLVILTAPTGVDYRYQWSPAAFLRDDSSALNRFSAPEGEYWYNLQVSTPEVGCSAEDSILIRVIPPFEIESVSPRDTTIKLGDRIQLHAEGAANSWLWLPVTYLDDPNSPSPYTRPDESMVYKIIGTDQHGCQDTAEVKINVTYGSNTFIPTAFSPNGDGVNDYFNVANLRFERLLEFKVFNRYGQVVFDARDEGGEEGWDGTVGGKPAATDTYFYLIRVVVPFENEPRVFKGDVVLLR